MNKELKISIIAGGNDDEKEWSLLSGKAILDALTTHGYRVRLIELWDKGQDLGTFNPDVAFIASFSKGGNLQGFLEVMGIPYTGSNAASSAIAMNKYFSKSIFTSNNILTPPFQLIHPKDRIDDKTLWKKICAKFKSEIMLIKPLESGLSHGISIVKTFEEFRKSLENKREDMIIEEFVEGIELTIGVVRGNDIHCFYPIEVIKNDVIVNYERDFENNRLPYRKAPLDSLSLETVCSTARSAFNCLGCAGIGYVDMIYNQYLDMAFVLEVGTIPGFTNISKVPYSASLSGLGFLNLLELSIDLALNNGRIDIVNYLNGSIKVL